MAMPYPKTVIEEFAHELKNSNLVTEDFNEKQLYDILCQKHNNRLKILRLLLSKFTDSYAEVLRDDDTLKFELVKMLNDLQFTDSKNKITFVAGTCPITEQKRIFDKVFRALYLVSLGKEVQRDQEDILEPVDIPMELLDPDYQAKDLCSKKRLQAFDITKAMKALQESEELLQISADLKNEELLDPDYQAKDLCSKKRLQAFDITKAKKALQVSEELLQISADLKNEHATEDYIIDQELSQINASLDTLSDISSSTVKQTLSGLPKACAGRQADVLVSAEVVANMHTALRAITDSLAQEVPVAPLQKPTPF